MYIGELEDSKGKREPRMLWLALERGGLCSRFLTSEIRGRRVKPTFFFAEPSFYWVCKRIGGFI